MSSKSKQKNIFVQTKQNSLVTNIEDILFKNGMELLKQGRPELAIEIFEKIIKLNEKNFNATHVLAQIAGNSGHWEKALNYFGILINLNNSIPSVHNNYGIVLKKLGFQNEALSSYERAIYLKHDFIEAIYNRGIILNEVQRYEEAIASFEKVIALSPLNAEAYNNCGMSYKEIGKLKIALEYYNKAIELNSLNAEAYYNIGIVYSEMHNLSFAINFYKKAIELNPNFIQAFFNLGQALARTNQYKEALESYQKAYAIQPEYINLFGTIIFAQMNICDWTVLKESIKYLLLNINNNLIIEPFPLLAITDSVSTQLNNTIAQVQFKFPLAQKEAIPKYKRKEKIRIAYVSADFREHPVAFLIAEMLEKHDKSLFEIYGFYAGPSDNSVMHQRILSCFDGYFHIQHMSNTEVKNKFRNMEIDISVDLTGLTSGERIGVFSQRVAPIQLSYIGYLGSMGAKYYDYLIADKTLIPSDAQPYYSEKIVYLPHYQVNDGKRVISNKEFSKSELHLPDSGFVFCCFNNNYKITPTMFDSWMKILNNVPESVLFLYASNKWAESNLLIEAEKRGVDQSRLVFGGVLERSDYLARYKVTDLFLDTFPYNAGTTASDALWAGLPVLTLMGDSFASRVAASVLTAIELPELIAHTQAQYEEMAIELALNPEILKQIRDKIERNRFTTPLFNAAQFTKNIEAAYVQMYERYQSDLPPDNIYI